MQKEPARKYTRNIESQIGWKARQELIRAIQERKGENSCFHSGKEFCDQYDCSWRNKCKPDAV